MQLDTIPELAPIRVLIGETVRKSPDLLQVHLASLTSQICPPRIVPSYCMVDDNTDLVSSHLLAQWVTKHHGTYIDSRQGDTGDFSDTHALTHQWTPESMKRVGERKNRIIQEAIQGGYDALWLLDADLILSPRVLWSLWYADAPIACAVFWTRWQDTPECPPYPQVWLRHPYQLDGRGLNLDEFLNKLVSRERVQVWGQGACTLYRRDALQKGVNFDYLPDLPTVGMWVGEDRHLCTKAERLHVPMYADAWPNIAHIYHPRQQVEAEGWFTKLSQETNGSPGVEDLVSLHLQALEPVQNGDGGGWFHVQRQHVRGRLGRLPLAIELEDAVRGMKRGEQRIVKVSFPTWSPSPFKGQRRLIEVTLIDHKPNALPVGV